ncbi:12671_t:CDS:2 [Dentiscutata erythropus]|uniref:12671_t:CDS:1 n=1 Tax=Dentiscutata erythropus TaxID=1348616 RepID=A0A9N9EAY2_9GLOM|nr:12671_t:CDS:2 [Dentiscutata erythropus]
MQIDKPLTTNNDEVDSWSFQINPTSQDHPISSQPLVSPQARLSRKILGADTILRKIKKKTSSKHLTAKAKRRQKKGLSRALMNIEKAEVKIAKVTDRVTLKKKIKNIWG